MSDDARLWHHTAAEGFPYGQPRTRVPARAITPLGRVPAVRWTGKTNLRVWWGGCRCDGVYEMYQHRLPVRMHTPNAFRYTFRDQDDAVIPLTGYVEAYCLLKRQGVVYERVAARMDATAATGKVYLDSYTFPEAGVWDAQFVLKDASGMLVYGDPAQFRVVQNLDDLAGDTLPEY